MLNSIFVIILSFQPILFWATVTAGQQITGNKSNPILKSLDLEIKIGYLTGSARKVGDLEYSRPGLTISGGLTCALHDLNGTDSFFGGVNVRFKLIVAETHGDEEESIRQVADLWRKHNVAVILGPQETCLHEAKLAASLNIPMISYYCSDEQTSDKKHFSTFSRTRPPDAAISKAVASLVLKYDWRSSLVMIYSESTDDQRFKRVAKSLTVLFKEKGVTTSQIIGYRGPYHHGYGENPFDSIVAQTKEKTRIYIIISEYFEHLGLVLALKKNHLLDNGDYLVIGVSMDDYKEEEWNPRRYFRGLLRDESEKDAPMAFRSYLGIVASPPKNFTEFSRRINYFMEKPPFNWPNPLAKVGGYKKIRIEAAYLYDAVWVYAQALRSTISDLNVDGLRTSEALALLNSRVFNGLEISMKLRNISYKSATGHESEMDGNGDAGGNFTLVTLKEKNGEFGLYPVGFFVQHTELPELALTESIDWVGGTHPVSEPKCGFLGEKCQSDNTSLLATGLFAVVFLFIGSALYLGFRHWRLTRDMDTLMWRIEKREVEWETEHLFPVSGQPITTGSQASLAKFSSVFAPLVKYRGRLFAAKRIDVDFLDAAMKHQLKLLREIRHENLNAFIGACHFEEGLLIVNEYCSRGSIKDILENGDLKLDDMFVSSLVGDLLRGLSYLHDSSQFRFHGNLKPTNCLVDSRWVLKLSDFGLTSGSPWAIKRRLDSSKIHQTQTNYNSQGSTRVSFTSSTAHGLLTAAKACNSPYLPPEYNFLCNGEVKNTVEGFRRGDMYSLGVILWELLRRETLANFLGTKIESEIRIKLCTRTINGNSFWTGALGLLRNSIVTASIPPSPSEPPTSMSTLQLNGPSNPYFHHSLHLSPGIPNLEKNINRMSNNNNSNRNVPNLVLDCLDACLQFEPDLRPDIKSARLRLRPLHKGMRSNIFDIMIGLMEKYANNLEILVDERTKQLSEEKRKTDTLLYELIPASVAEELKEGLRVPAQNYDCVSIYFSDIVGFTSMSAQSTALQVVELLNDLYTCFDAVIENFDVYKVETIGDAYMVASGLPVPREGNFHALEMARMALQLLRAVLHFQIRHRPTETLKLRIGIHSGAVCAGVVGQKRPRYCLFGDTVNTASRMESTGLPLRIHCSQAFAALIYTKFELEKRGVVDVKGKGDMTTFWLIGEKSSVAPT